MKLNRLTLAVLFAALPATGVFAAALDRSGQAMNAFFQEGNYFEAGLSVLDPDVSGKDTSNNNVEDMGKDYMFATAAIKLQPHEKVSVGLLYDQPFGADAQYSGSNRFVSTTNDPVLGSLPITTGNLSAMAGSTAPTGATSVKVDTHNLSLIAGFQPNKNFNIYAGPVYQTIEGEVKLRGATYSLYNGYDLNVPRTGGWGWLAGAAYQIPEIALRAAITYRSEIDHDINAYENLPLANSLTTAMSNGSLASNLGAAAATIAPTAAAVIAANQQTGKTKATTPQSVNLDLQSGIMENTIAFANIRWVNWKDFAIQPYKFGRVSEAIGPLVSKPNGFNLVDYSKDQWSVNVGVGRKFNDKWTGSASVGWDSGAGNPVTTLGPVKGYWNTGVGVQYSPAKNYFIAGGVKYFWLGDATAQTGAHSRAGTFEGNNAIAYGLKMGYRF